MPSTKTPQRPASNIKTLVVLKKNSRKIRADRTFAAALVFAPNPHCLPLVTDVAESVECKWTERNAVSNSNKNIKPIIQLHAFEKETRAFHQERRDK